MTDFKEEEKIIKIIVLELINKDKIIAKIDVNQFVNNNNSYSGKLRENFYLLEDPAYLIHTYDSNTKLHYFDVREYAPDSEVGSKIPIRKDHVTSFRYARKEVVSLYVSKLGLDSETLDSMVEESIKEFLDNVEFDEDDIQ